MKVAGSFGADAVSAVTSGHRIYFILHATVMGLCSGTTALVARSWGAKHYSLAGDYAVVSQIIFCALAAIIAWPCILFADNVIGIFELNEASAALAASFLRWTALFAPIAVSPIILNMSSRAIGDTVTPLLIALSMALMTAGGAAVLAFGLFGLPALDVKGIAIGGNLGTTLVMILFLWIWLSGKLDLPAIWIRAKTLVRTKELLSIGYPAALEQLLMQASLVFYLTVLAQYGSAAFAAYGIGVSILALVIVAAFSFAMTGAALVGQAVGAGQPTEAIAAGWRTMRSAVSVMLVLACLLLWQAENLALFMIEDPEVVTYATQFMMLVAVLLIPMAVEFSLAGALRGAGDTRFPLFSTILGLIFGRIIAPIILVKIEAPVIWLYMTLGLDYILKAALVTWRYRSLKWLKGRASISAT